MTSTRKTLMIVGGLLVAAAGTGYVMLLRADHRAIAEAGIGDSAAPAAAVANANDGHTAEGAIAPPPTVHVVTVEPEGATPPKVKPAQSVQSAPPVQAAQASQPSQQAYQPPQHAVRKRDGLERHAAATTTTVRHAGTPETAELVRESAKLDPSLPPPQYVPPSNPGQQRASAGSNAVAAAMTDQLVRQSSSFKAPAPTPTNAGPAVAQ
ncbi:extensin [Burkholderia anthina]|uniref:extensin n=1 Tax=Burkholderia anthina TaxID=179879 RepID=UPI001CF0FCBC|nr:extensin [Burkholderia anthina]MCA8091186.1 extensin [Burkholderia anthina]